MTETEQDLRSEFVRARGRRLVARIEGARDRLERSVESASEVSDLVTAVTTFEAELAGLQSLAEGLRGVVGDDTHDSIEWERMNAWCIEDLAALAELLDAPMPRLATNSETIDLETLLRSVESLALRAESTESLSTLHRWMRHTRSGFSRLGVQLFPRSDTIEPSGLVDTIEEFEIEAERIRISSGVGLPCPVEINVLCGRAAGGESFLRVQQHAVLRGSEFDADQLVRLSWDLPDDLREVWCALSAAMSHSRASEGPEQDGLDDQAEDLRGVLRDAWRSVFRAAWRGAEGAALRQEVYDCIRAIYKLAGVDAAQAKLCVDVCDELARSLEGWVTVVDQGYLGRLDVSEHEVRIDTSNWEFHGRIPVGETIRFVRNGYEFHERQAAVLPAVVTRSAGVVSPLREVIKRTHDRFMVSDDGRERYHDRCEEWERGSDAKFFVKLNEIAREHGGLGSSIDGKIEHCKNQVSLDVLRDMLPFLERELQKAGVGDSVRELLAQSFEDVVDAIERYGPDHGIELIRPDLAAVYDAYTSLEDVEGVEFVEKYHPTIGFGHIIEITQTGIRDHGQIVRSARVVLSLGRTPFLIEGIERLSRSGVFEGQHKFEQIASLQGRLARDQSSRTLEELRREVLRTALDLQRSANLAELIGGHPLDSENPLTPFAQFLTYVDIYAFPTAWAPGGAAAEGLDPGGVDVPRWLGERTSDKHRQWFEVLDEYLADVPRGHVARVKQYGFWSADEDERTPAIIIVSRGERNELNQRITEILEGLDALNADTALLRAGLARIAKWDEKRQAAKRLIESIAEAGDSDEGAQGDFGRAEQRMAEEVKSAVQTFEEFARDNPDALDAAMRSIDRLLIATRETLRMHEFPREGATLRDGEFEFDHYAKIEPYWSANEPALRVTEVIERGLIRGDELLRKASIRLSLGPCPAFRRYLERLHEVLGNSEGSTLADDVRALVAATDLATRRRTPIVSDDRVLEWSLRCLEFSVELSGAHSDVADDVELLELLDELEQEVGRSRPGLRRFGSGVQRVAEADSAFFEMERVRDTRDANSVLEVVREGYRWSDGDSDRALFRARVRVSLGPGSREFLELEKWARFSDRLDSHNARLFASMRDAFEAADADGEEAIFEPVALAELTCALDCVASSDGSKLASDGPLGDRLREIGWSSFPDQSEQSPDQLSGPNYDGSTGLFRESSDVGDILNIECRGWLDERGVLSRPACVTWSRGPVEYLGELVRRIEADKDLQTPGLIDYISDQSLGSRQSGTVAGDGAALVICYDIRDFLAADGAAPSVVEWVDDLLSQRGATVFPAVGEQIATYAPLEREMQVERIYSDDDPSGTIIEVPIPGLLWKADGRKEVLRMPEVRVSRGRQSELDSLLQGAGPWLGRLQREDPTSARFVSQWSALSVDDRLEPENLLMFYGAVEKWGVTTADSDQRDWARTLCQQIQEHLDEPGYRFVPRSIGSSERELDGVDAERFSWRQNDASIGVIVAIEQTGIIDPSGKQFETARVYVNRGPETPLFNLIKSIQSALLDSEIIARRSSDYLSFADLLQRAADLDEEAVSPAIELAGYLYRLKDSFRSRGEFRRLRSEVLDFLDDRGVLEFICEGDPRAKIEQEHRRIKIENPEVLTKSRNCQVERILRPGFEQDGKTIQQAEIRVREKR